MKNDNDNNSGFNLNLGLTRLFYIAMVFVGLLLMGFDVAFWNY